MIKRYWIGVCLAFSVFVSCKDTQSNKNDNGIDSLVTRTKAQIWGIMKTDDAPAQQVTGLIKTRVYSANVFAEKGGAEQISQNWQSVLTVAERDSSQIYINQNLDKAVVKTIISSPVQQAKGIKALLSNLKELSAKGVAINFGDVDPQDISRYLTYIKKLAGELHTEKFKLAIVVPPVNSFDIRSLESLVASADYLLFDFSDTGKGSNQSSVNFKGIEQTTMINVVTHALTSTIDPGKLLLVFSSGDENLASRCDFALHLNLGGIVINYSGKKDDEILGKTLKEKFVYVDTIRKKQ